MNNMMLFPFRLAIFLGAGLLFLIQPLFAKMALPLLGGSPAVWNTCMLFFQGMLLAGYAYAHLTQRLLGIKIQIVLHWTILFVVMLLPIIAIPSAWTPPEHSSPVFWLLGLLLVVVGGPFFAVSATSPLLQQWFSATDHPRAKNPYFLYSASNFGSMIALICYPFFIEKFFRIETQTLIWTSVYWLFIAAMAVCGYLVLKTAGNIKKPTDVSSKRLPNQPEVNDSLPNQPLIGWSQRGWWVALSFVPSSWMLGVTSFLTTDISPIPILWIIPLTLYLVTFIVAFADQPLLRYQWVSRLFPISMMVLAASTMFKGGIFVLLLHLVVFFVGAMVCHFELARKKPSPSHLTEFYFWVSFGGLLGGVFNGLLAPLVFPWILEYPVTLFIACLLRPTLAAVAGPDRGEKRREKTTLPKAVGKNQKAKSTKRKKTTASGGDFQHEDQQPAESESRFRLGWFALFVLPVGIMAQTFPFQEGTVALTIATLVSLLILVGCYFLDKPRSFAFPIGLVFVFSQLEPPQAGETVLLTQRGYFGVNRVVDGPEGHQRRLYHGKTIHGLQNLDPERPGLLNQPTSYYHRTGPLGEIFSFAQKQKPFKRVAIIGLGAGTAACYHREGQEFTFFEIDPIVKEIATNPRFFTFLENCGKENYEVILGDGRMKLNEVEDDQFDLMIFDAFSSDAIPMHLLTLEAVQVYQGKLSPEGFMAFHISNRFFDLEPILGDLASAMGWESMTWHDIELSEEELLSGKAAASYVILARDLNVTGLTDQPHWKKTRMSTRGQPWTDDFSNVLDALKWESERARQK